MLRCDSVPLNFYNTIYPWIFDISLSLNSKSRYKVRHKTTDAAQSVFRTRVRGE
jgi:hypothetical protein